jgi:hypothetical protein
MASVSYYRNRDLGSAVRFGFGYAAGRFLLPQIIPQFVEEGVSPNIKQRCLRACVRDQPSQKDDFPSYIRSLCMNR